MRTQHWKTVDVTLDGDAHCRAWAPNHPDDPFDVDLLDHVAMLVFVGLDAPPALEPHWTRPDGLTLIVDISFGSEGSARIGGHPCSESAAVRLVAAGFIEVLTRSLREGDPDSEADPGEDGVDEPLSDDADPAPG